MEELKRCMIQNTALRNIFLWGVGLTVEGKQMISSSTILIWLGSIEIAESMTENETLQRLELRNNDVGLAGLLAFRL